MPWTKIARREYARRSQRYSSDLTDQEWSLVEPFLRKPRPVGRPHTTDLREVVNADVSEAMIHVAMGGLLLRRIAL